MRDDRREGHGPWKVGVPMQLAFRIGDKWSKPAQIPIIGHTPVVGLLEDGRILMTYRDISAAEKSDGERCNALWIADVDDDVDVDPANFMKIFMSQSD